MKGKLPLTLRILAALKLRAFTVGELRAALSVNDASIRVATRKLLDAGLIEKRTQVSSGGSPAWLYGVTP